MSKISSPEADRYRQPIVRHPHHDESVRSRIGRDPAEGIMTDNGDQQLTPRVLVLRATKLSRLEAAMRRSEADANYLTA